MNTPADRKYTETHEWVEIEDGVAVVGITDYAQDSLGDITFVELPDVGVIVSHDEECAVVESVKAASDLYAPVSGEICEVNPDLESKPELLNDDPYGEGWIFKISDFDDGEYERLMDADEYKATLDV